MERWRDAQRGMVAAVNWEGVAVLPGRHGVAEAGGGASGISTLGRVGRYVCSLGASGPLQTGRM